jgi:hypothetical protein
MPILLMKCEEERCQNLSRDGIQEGFAQKSTIKVEAVRRNNYYNILNIFQSENQVKRYFNDICNCKTHQKWFKTRRKYIQDTV